MIKDRRRQILVFHENESLSKRGCHSSSSTSALESLRQVHRNHGLILNNEDRTIFKSSRLHVSPFYAKGALLRMQQN